MSNPQANENKKIITLIREVLRAKPDEKVHLHEPEFKGNEWVYTKECLDTGWISSAGPYVGQFEKKLAAYTGAAYAVAVVNGTAALHVGLKLVGVERGDEVLMPALTFVASANAVAYCGATPHFVDCDEKTLGVDPIKLALYLRESLELKSGESFNRRTGRRVRALLPMHTFGHPVDLDPLVELCKEFHLVLVEDAAESIGSTYKGRHTGQLGRVSALSFNGNKIVTTGGGGAILTNDKTLAEHAKHLSTTAKVPHAWEFYHDEVGYNYRMPNLNAAVGCAQLERLPTMLAHKRALTEKYLTAFKGLHSAALFREADFAKSNYWLNALIFKNATRAERNQFLEDCQSAGVMARPVWNLMNHLPAFKECPRMDLSCAESLEQRIVNIPSSAKWGEA